MSIFSKLGTQKLLNNTIFSVILSFILAFVIWLSIVINQTPVIERTITNIPIVFDTAGTMAEDYKLEVVNYHGIQSGSATVSGPAYIVSSLSSEDFEIRMSLSSVSQPGEYTVQLNATKKEQNSDYSIISFSPTSLVLTFDRISEKAYNVSDIAVNAPVSAQEGFVIYNKAVSTSDGDTLVVKGARTDIERIASVSAIVSLENPEVLSEAKAYTAEITFYDRTGRIIDSSLFEYNLKTVEVRVSVYKVKTVGISINILNNPQNIKESYHKRVELMGPADVIDEIVNDSITCSIDYKKITTEKGVMKINLTDIGLGAEILTADGENYITVKV